MNLDLFPDVMVKTAGLAVYTFSRLLPKYNPPTSVGGVKFQKNWCEFRIIQAWHRAAHTHMQKPLRRICELGK